MLARKMIIDTLHYRLDAETFGPHAHLDSQYFFDRLRNDPGAFASWVTYLVCLAIIYAPLEQKIRYSPDPRIAKFRDLGNVRLQWLNENMRQLRPEKYYTIQPAIRAALELASEIVVQDSRGIQSVAILGRFYPLERMRLCMVFQKEFLPKPISAFQFHTSWKLFMLEIDSLNVNETEVRGMIASSISTFSLLSKMLSVLFPFKSEDLKFHITSVNPEAGSHPIPQSVFEIEAALMASNRTQERFPYLIDRYGERGVRFSSSDCCWLVALLPLKLEVIQKSISWFQVILSKRGIPSIILEAHLEEIIRVFEKMFPERAAETDKFLRIVVSLKTKRLEFFESDWFDGTRDLILNKIYLNKVGPVTPLLASAWVDELTLAQGAFEIVRDWFTTSSKFSASWIFEIHRISKEIMTHHG